MTRYSPSKIKCYESCKLQFKLKYLDEIKVEEVKTSDTQFGLFMHKFMELYDGTNKQALIPLVKEFELTPEYKKFVIPTIRNFFEFFEANKKYEYETEKEYELKTESYWIFGIIDRIMSRSKDMVVVDYKTAAYPNRDRHIFQMKFYSLMVSKIVEIEPKNIKTLIYFPRPNKEEKFAFSNVEIENFEKEIITTIKTIEDTTEWSACKGFHCKWCKYKESYCPIYKVE